MLKRFLTIVLLLTAVAISNAQPGGGYSSEDKKALKKFEEARAAYTLRNVDEALEAALDAVERDPKFIEAHLLLGYIYADTDQYQKARESFKTAIQINPSYMPETFFTLGSLEIGHGDYASAKQNFEAYLSFRKSGDRAKVAEQQVLNCDFGIWALANPVPFEPKNMGPNINSDRPEYFPCITTDDRVFFYTRLLEDNQAYQGIQEDFYVSTKVDGEWIKSKNLMSPINTHLNEGAGTLSSDGQTLVFTACELTGEGYGPNRRGKGSCDLFYTYKVGEKWSRPVNIGGGINSYHWETQPSFASDGMTMYFVRGLRKQDGPLTGDIYVSRLNEQGYWETPERLGPNINTVGHEASVLIHPDGQTLYFASDGHTGMGGLDIYMSRLQPNGEWGKPINLGYPINTFNDENSLLVSGDGQVAFFASDREGGFGDLDLYQFDLPKKFQPQPLTYMRGTVYDKSNQKKLEAMFELIDLETGKVAVRSYSNPMSGEFLVSLPINREYALNVSRDGYYFYTENFELKSGTAIDPFLKDVPLEPIEVRSDLQHGIVLKNVFFDTDKFDLKPKSKVELNKLAAWLLDNPELKIELGGHTDNKGTPSHNKTLSENRAKAVMDYLINVGINPERLTSQGYGETMPIDTNDTDEGRAQNRRTEYKVVGKIVIER